MIGKNIELIITSKDDLKNINHILINCDTVYALPEFINNLNLIKMMNKFKYKIYTMIDYPKGTKFGVDKFKGVDPNFFLVDGYDVILGNNQNIEEEIKIIHTFILDMIDKNANICYTINASIRNKDTLNKCSMAFFKHKPVKIKLEAQPSIQPTKANLVIHKENIELIRKNCIVPIVVSGNINNKILNEFNGIYKIAMSVDQYNKLKKEK